MNRSPEVGGAAPTGPGRILRASSIAVIIPCFNEAATIENCLRGVADVENVSCIAVVDDASTDDTIDGIAAFTATGNERLRVFRLAANRGKNAAIRYAAERLDLDIVIIFDADQTIDPQELQTVVECLREDGHTFVYASRLRSAMDCSAMSPWKLLGNRLFAAWVSRLVGIPMTDVLCGLKAVPRSVLLSRKLSACRWGDLDVIFAAADGGLRFREIPVAYRRRVGGVSKMNVVRAGSHFALQCLLYWNRRRNEPDREVEGRHCPGPTDRLPPK